MNRSERNEVRSILRDKVYRTLEYSRSREYPHPEPSAELQAQAEAEHFFLSAMGDHPETVAYYKTVQRQDEQIRELEEEILIATLNDVAGITDLLKNFDKKLQALKAEWEATK